MPKITISVPEHAVMALAGGDKSRLASKLKNYVLDLARDYERVTHKIKTIHSNIDQVLYIAELLANTDSERLTIATLEATKTLLTIIKDTARSEHYKLLIDVLEHELRRAYETRDRREAIRLALLTVGAAFSLTYGFTKEIPESLAAKVKALMSQAYSS